LLTAKDFSELGRTVRYQSLFISNILFMREDGYFQPASDLKPLLHTWSLVAGRWPLKSSTTSSFHC
jgi:peptidoglycan/LPS O-acetylase OafA/YrhL